MPQDSIAYNNEKPTKILVGGCMFRSLIVVLGIFCLTSIAFAQDDSSCRVISAGEVNVRGGPGTNYLVREQLASGDSADVTGQALGRDGYVWWELGDRRWLRSDVVSAEGDCDAVPDVLDIPMPPVTYNDQWTPVVRDFDGMQMVLVPVGCFQMGYIFDDAPMDYWDGDEWIPYGDGGIQCFDEPFWIGRYEVTQAQYPGCPNWLGKWCGADIPRIGMDWQHANDFCESLDMRLPTEAEWEYAARGPDGLWHAWGNHFDPEYVVYARLSGEPPAPVGSKEGDVSWVGAYDMTGNIAEWLSTWLLPYPYNADDGREGEGSYHTKVARSGAGDAIAIRLFNRGGHPPDTGVDSGSGLLGLRCARDYTFGDLDLPDPTLEEEDN